jgi:hypothetical protein
MAPTQAKMLDGGSCRPAKNLWRMALRPMMEVSGIFRYVYVYTRNLGGKKKLTYAKKKPIDRNWRKFHNNIS